MVLSLDLPTTHTLIIPTSPRFPSLRVRTAPQSTLSDASHAEFIPDPEEGGAAATSGDGDGEGDGGFADDGGRGLNAAKAQRAEAEQFQDKVEKELESDMGKNVASLAGAINMVGRGKGAGRGVERGGEGRVASPTVREAKPVSVIRTSLRCDPP